MYSDAFCKVYNQFGWNYFPEAFGEQLLTWLHQYQITVRKSLDLACGTGVLCEILAGDGIEASGMDFSEGMIEIAKQRNPEISYEVADMITYRPDEKFDLVTCTGDALNHIMRLEDMDRIFANVSAYLAEGGYFIFDILNEKEVPMAEPIDLDFSETVKAQFMVTHDPDGCINLKTTVYENGVKQFEENIKEIVHDEKAVCELLRKNGFRVEKCANHFLENEGNFQQNLVYHCKKIKRFFSLSHNTPRRPRPPETIQSVLTTRCRPLQRPESPTERKPVPREYRGTRQ